MTAQQINERGDCLMEWGKLFGCLPDDPRVQAVEDKDSAGWLLVQSMCYCTRAESDGIIPDTQVPRFGGPKLDRRVRALASVKLWIRVDDGWLLDPELWNEERNLSDAAERKKKADRDRIAAKRAAKKAADGDVSRDMSRDNRATPSATDGQGEAKSTFVPTGIPTSNVVKETQNLPCAEPSEQVQRQSQGLNVARQSRTEKRREDKTLPPAPRQPSLWPAAVPSQGEGEISRTEKPRDDIAALVDELRAVRPDWTRRQIETVLADRSVRERPAELVRRAALLCARDRATRLPTRLVQAGDWWALARVELLATGAPAAVPWCEQCSDPFGRQDLTDPDWPKPCEHCHPLRQVAS